MYVLKMPAVQTVWLSAAIYYRLSRSMLARIRAEIQTCPDR